MAHGGGESRIARLRRGLCGAVAAVVLLLVASTAIAEPPPATKDGDVPSADVIREAERIRRELGGSAIERFELLRDPERPRGAPAPGKDLSRRPGRTERQIAVLRRAAQDLDLAANRVEEIEAYAEADQIRTTAQRLRRMARRLAEAGSSAPSAAEPGGAAPVEPDAPVSRPGAASE